MDMGWAGSIHGLVWLGWARLGRNFGKYFVLGWVKQAQPRKFFIIKLVTNSPLRTVHLLACLVGGLYCRGYGLLQLLPSGLNCFLTSYFTFACNMTKRCTSI